MAKSYEDVKKEFLQKQSANTTVNKSEARQRQDEINEANKSKARADAKSAFDSFYTDSQNYLKNSQNASSYYKNNVGKYEDLAERSKAARSYVSGLKDTLDWESYNSLTSYINDFDKYSKISNDYYSQWDSEDKYNEAVEALKDYNQKIAFNLDEGKKELDTLTAALDKAKSANKEKSSVNDSRSMSMSPQRQEYVQNINTQADKEIASALESVGYDSILDLQKAVDEKTTYYNQAAHLQESYNLEKTAQEDADFEMYAQLGASLENPTYAEAVNAKYYGRQGRDIQIQNIVTFSRENSEGIRAAQIINGQYAGNADYANMTDDEVKVYNYYLTKDKETAQRYLDSLEERLNQREGAQQAEYLKTLGVAAELVFGVGAGFDQFGQGMSNLWRMITKDDDYISPSATQYASQYVKEDLAEKSNIYSTAYDVITTSANMAPNIAASALANALGSPVLGTIVSTALMSASATGNEYQELLNSGMNKSQAKGMATALGLWEGVSESALGAIEGVGGQYLSKAVGSKLKEGFVAGVGKFLLDMAQEGGEEVIQDIGSSIIKGLYSAAGNEFEFSSLSDLAYSFTLGALSAGVLNGASQGVGWTQYISEGINTKGDKGRVEALKQIGNTMAADTVAYKLAGSINENTGAYTLSRMLHSIDANLSEQNQTDIKNALVESGMSETDAEDIAGWLSNAVDGRELTNAQQQALDNNPIISQVYKQVIIDRNSTVNQRLSNYYRARGNNVAVGVDLEGLEKANSPEGLTKSVNDRIAIQKAYENLTKTKSSQQQNYIDQRVAEAVKEMNSTTAQSVVSNIKKNISDKISDNATDIKSIKSIDNGKIVFNTEDGKTVNNDKVKYASEDEAVLYESLIPMGYDAQTANAIVNGYKATNNMSVTDYIYGINEAYNYGKTNYPMDKIKMTGFYADLTDSQRAFAYQLGQNASVKETNDRQAAVESAVESNKGNNKRKGKVVFDSSSSTLTDRQKTSASAIGRVVADITHNNVYLYESVEDENGNRVFAKDIAGYKAGEKAPNGWYNPKTGAIYLDINAGNFGEGTMLWTFAHELTHYIRQWSPTKFKALADFLMQEYGEKNVDIQSLIQSQMAKAKNAGRPISFDQAYEEVVADAMQTMFTDTNLAEKLARSKATNQSLWQVWQKIKDFFERLFKNIQAVYKGLDPQSMEAQYLRSFSDKLEQISDMFAEAIYDAGNNFAVAESVGVNIDIESESANPSLLMSERTWTESDYMKSRDIAAQEMAKTLGISVKKAIGYIDTVNSIAKMIANDRVRLDYEASEGVSSFISNAEYGGSIDFSTICKKRRLLTGTFTEIQKALPNTALTAEEVLKIRKMMDDKGYEVSCGLCYVEGSRAKMGEYAKDFLDSYKKTNPDYVPNMAEINTPEGLEDIRKNHPDTYAAYVKYMNSLAQRKPKLYQMATEYNGEILNKFRKSDSVKDKNDNGGLRLQSFSDFEIIHLIDCMQVIMDMSRVGLAGQAYTKVPDFALALGNTGLKINLSLIAKGVDANGKIILDEKEGMKKADAERIRNMYSNNVGTILVVFNDEQLYAAMADDFIDFIIPFHRSQWNQNLYKLMGLPENAKDYTSQQNESYIEDVYNKNGKKMRPQNYMPIKDYWNFSKSGKENAQAYLTLCAANNRVPKFSKLLVNNGDGSYSLKPDGSTDGYWKLLIDFKMYDNDGKGAPQMPVVPNFNMDEATRMLDEYEGGHEKFPVAEDVVKEFVNEYKETHPDNVYSERDGQKPRTAQAQRDEGYMLSEAKFYQLYSAHKLDIGRRWGDIQKQIDDIKTNGFKGGSGTINVLPASISQISSYRGVENYNTLLEMENEGKLEKGTAENYKQTYKDKFGVDFGTPAFRNIVQEEFVPRKDEYILLVPQSELNFYKSKVKQGFKPFDYEIVKADYDYQPYYEMYVKAYNQSKSAANLNSTGNQDIRYSIRNIVDDKGRDYGAGVYLDSTLLNNLTDSERIEMVKEYIKELGGSVFTAFDNNGKAVNIQIAKPNEKFINKNGKRVFVNKDLATKNNRLRTKQEAISLIDELVTTAKNPKIMQSKYSHGWLDNLGKNNWEYWTTYLQDKENTIWKAILNIANSSKGEKILYDINKIKKVGRSVKSDALPTTNSILQDNSKSQEVSQKISSAKTSIKQIPALFKNSKVEFGKTNVDIGGGRFDLATQYLAERGTKNYIFDPFNRSDAENTETLNFIIENGGADTATCANVLNVIAEANARANVILETAKAIKPDGTAYFMVYEGNQSGVGKETSAGWQNNRNTEDYVSEIEQYFGDVTRKGKLIIAKEPIVDEKAYWETSPGNVTRYSERDSNAVDNRTLLSNALSTTAQNEYERKLIEQYQNKIASINAEQNKLAELRAKIKDISFSKGKRDMAELNRLRNEATATANRITTYDKQLLRLEATKPLRDVLIREKQSAMKRIEQENKEYMESYKEGVAKRDYVSRIEKVAYDLQDRLTHPSAKKAIPEVFGKTVANFLKALDFTTFTQDGNIRPGKANITRDELRRSITELASNLESMSISENSEYGNLDISPDMMTWLTETSKYLDDNFQADETVYVRKMSAKELNNLYKTLKNLQAAVNSASRFYTAMSEDVSELANDTISYLEPLYNRKTNTIFNSVEKMLRWDYAQPITVFDRFGKSGDTLMQMLTQGQKDEAKNIETILNFVDTAYTEKEVNQWKNELNTIQIGDKTYEVSTAFLMEFYELLKDPDARRHILEGGGIRFDDLKINNKIQKFTDTIVTQEDIDRIVNLVESNPRVKEVADKLEKFLATIGAEWGNKISMTRFGYHAFGNNPNYYPIKTIKSGSEYEARQKRANIYALLNKSFTKERNINANNAIIVGDIFDTFNNHMSEMAIYNAWALPVIDLLKWFNYREVSDIDGKPSERSTKEALRQAFGMDKQNPADEYIRRLLESINSQKSGGLSESVAFKNLRLVNRVAVAANIRVAIQQPFSITRALELIPAKYVKVLVGKARRAAYDEMIANSSFGLWKSMGYYDVDISRPLSVKILKNATFADKVTEKSMVMAEDGDAFTWAVLWNACKNEAKAKNPTLSDKEIIDLAAKKFDDLILRTQVVDSVLTKSQWMRSDSFFHRMTSSFMSEPMTSYNTLLRRFDQFSRDKAISGTQTAIKNNASAIAKTSAIFILTQLVNALVTAPIDAMRDDDDYKTYIEKLLAKFKSNAIENLIPTSLMPYISDVVEYAIYGKTDRPDMQLFTKVIDLGKQIKSTVDSYNYYKLHKTLKSGLSTISSLTGLPMSNVVRDLVAIWNTVVGGIDSGRLKFQTAADSSSVGYDKLYKALSDGNYERINSLYMQMQSNTVSDSAINTAITSRIKDDYISGKITEDKANDLLLDISELTGKSIDLNDIHWKIDKWNYEKENGASDGYAKYNDFFTAVETGLNLKSVIKEYTDNGVETKTLASQITSHFKPLYVAMSKSERASIKGYLLNAYVQLGYDREKKSKDIDAWVK